MQENTTGNWLRAVRGLRTIMNKIDIYPKTGEYRKAYKNTLGYQCEKLGREIRKFLEPIIDILSKFLKTRYGKALEFSLKVILIIVMTATWAMGSIVVLLITLGIIGP